MARKLRLEYAGAIYHVMNRGDRQEPIFEDDSDRERFLEALPEACVKTGWQVHAYCLMGNHFHLVMQTPQANLVAVIHWFLSTFTARFYFCFLKPSSMKRRINSATFRPVRFDRSVSFLI